MSRGSLRNGFSLVELSIVLVILGLLTGGILAGQSLIRAAELRAVATEYHYYLAATQTFRDKYMALPGDMRNASQFWGFLNIANCANNTGTTNTPASGMCDGNGNGTLDDPTGTSRPGEPFMYWRELAAAGLIGGTYSGIACTSAHQLCSRPGVNVPVGRIANSGWSALNRTAATAYIDGGRFIMDYGNFYIFGVANGISDTSSPIMRPEEAWNIDTKLDDGNPTAGKIIGYGVFNGCTVPNTGVAAATNLDVSYALTSSAIVCALYFRQLF